MLWTEKRSFNAVSPGSQTFIEHFLCVSSFLNEKGTVWEKQPRSSIPNATLCIKNKTGLHLQVQL